MIRAKQLIDEVNRYLLDDDPDYEYTHWSEQDLLDYFRLAINIVASTQKDKFIGQKTVSLVTGAVQEIPKYCHDVPSVLGQIDSQGKVVGYPRHVVAHNRHLVGRLGCPDCRGEISGTYVVDSWTLDPSNPNVIYVDPPVPEGVDAQLRLSCYVPPRIDDVDSEVDLGDHLHTVIFHFMLSYAYNRDTESVPFRDRGTTHWNMAVQLLGGDAASQLSNRYTATRIPELRLGAKK